MLVVTLPFPDARLNPNRSNRVHWTLEEDDFLRQNWRTHSHAVLANLLGRAKSGVRNRCYRLGLVDKSGEWSKEEIAKVRFAYESATDNTLINLDQLAAELGRHKSNVSRKARAMGLSNASRKKVVERKARVPKFSCAEERSKDRSKRAKEWIAKNGHPKGALGLKHSSEAKAKMSEASKRWNASLTDEQKQELIIKALKTRAKNGTTAPPRMGATWKAGWREIGGTRKYYRSKWEANYAHYLQWLKEKGEIADWKHEPETFWFDGIKRGCVSYLPDFWVKETNGGESYHEVKGWMDSRSVTKIKRMAKYHPKVKLIVIDAKGYASLKKSVEALVPGWES